MNWLSTLWSGGGTPVVEAAQLRDAARLAQLHGASFHRGWGEGEFETMLRERNTLVHRLKLGRKVIGFAVSRMGADEAEILSIAVDATYRGRGWSRDLLLTRRIFRGLVTCRPFPPPETFCLHPRGGRRHGNDEESGS